MKNFLSSLVTLLFTVSVASAARYASGVAEGQVSFTPYTTGSSSGGGTGTISQANFNANQFQVDGTVASVKTGALKTNELHYALNVAGAFHLGSTIYLTNSTGDMQVGEDGTANRIRFLPYLGDVYFGNTAAGALIFRNNEPNTPVELFRAEANGILTATNAKFANFQFTNTGPSRTNFQIRPPLAAAGDTNSGLTVAGNGNVGVGTASPAFPLDVKGPVAFSYGNLGSTQYVGNINVVQPAGGGDYTFNSPYAANYRFVSQQSGQYSTLFAQTAEGKTFGFRHYDVANGLGRLGQVYSDAGVAITLNPGGLETLRATTAGLVGIGTTTPTAKLEVAGTQDSYLFRVNTNVLVVTNGNVGIGKSNPGGPLDVGGLVLSNGMIFSSSATDLSLRPNSSGNIRFENNLGVLRSFISAGDGSYEVGSSKFGSSAVGIGTTTPADKLDVIGNIRASGTNFATNGFAVFSTNAPTYFATTGYTNRTGVNTHVYVNGTGFFGLVKWETNHTSLMFRTNINELAVDIWLKPNQYITTAGSGGGAMVTNNVERW